MSDQPPSRRTPPGAGTFQSRGGRIRPAERADAPALADMANALARHLGVDGDHMTEAAAHAALFDSPTGLEAHVAITAGADAEPIGYALHHVSYETAFAAKGRYLSDLYVRPSARGLGVGRALMQAVAARADAEGGTFIWWVSTQAEGPATRLYAKVGDIQARVTSHAATRAAFRLLLRGA